VQYREILSVFLVALLAGCASANSTPSRGGGSKGGGTIGDGSPIDQPADTVLGNVNGPNQGLAGSASLPSKDPNVCASASVAARRITPDVYFVIDGSGSMNSRFGDGTRWSVLRDSLVGASGVITKLETVVKFGMAIYSNNDPNACPTMTDVKADLNNLMALSAAYPMQELGGGTPTGEALQKVIDGLPSFNNGPDQTGRPPIIILATDGEPNGCSSAAACNWAADWASCLGNILNQVANAPATYDTTLAAVRAAKDKAIPVWVISLADGLNSIPDLQKTANIGAGLDDNAMPGATIYSPQSPDDLTMTLSKLIGQAVTCDVELAGTLTVNRACEGTVTMNGEKIGCNDAQGWKATDANHIQLQGSSCDRFKSDPTVILDARFPCDVVVPQ
jgi:hypothetical protein